MPLYPVSSTRFGSTISRRRSSGVLFNSRQEIRELTHTDFPEPVAPATSRWGIADRFCCRSVAGHIFARAKRRGDFKRRKASLSITSRKATREDLFVGNLDAEYPCLAPAPGCGMVRAERARADRPPERRSFPRARASARRADSTKSGSTAGTW